MASLGNDLATLRKERELSVQDVYDITKIPIYIIQSIEDDSIFKQIDENTTYVRNYVRSYSRALGIEEAKIVKALNQIQEENYQGGLIETEQQTDSADSSTQEEKGPEAEQASSEAKDSNSSAINGNNSVQTRHLSKNEWEWVNVGRREPKPAAEKTSSKTQFAALIILILILTGAGLYFYFKYHQGVNTPSNTTHHPAMTSNRPQQHPAGADTTDTLRNRQITKSLPDTLQISIYAVRGKLNPVRVYTDINKKFTPYWVPKGDSLHLRFVDSVQIQAIDQYNLMQLIFYGHTIKNYQQKYYDKKSNMVRLNRAVFEKHPEWYPPANK
ncbi:MAG TPA: helix-turn-helix transcriptional regulator [Balneolaceae bacterium]|nr:helix-turn-helix transcriptional regulator [Balneolaceae bacterium]